LIRARLLAALLSLSSTPAPVDAMPQRMIAQPEPESAAAVDAGPPLEWESDVDGGASDVPHRLARSTVIPAGRWVLTDAQARAEVATKETCKVALVDAKAQGPTQPIGYVLAGAGGLVLGGLTVAFYFLTHPSK
jgi:hypothetical protein